MNTTNNNSVAKVTKIYPDKDTRNDYSHRDPESLPADGKEYADPKYGGMDVSQRQAFEIVPPVTSDWYNPFTWRKSGWISYRLWFNKYKKVEVTSLEQAFVWERPTHFKKPVEVNCKCWEEELVELVPGIRKFFQVQRYWEIWQVNGTLEDYYKFVSEDDDVLDAIGNPDLVGSPKGAVISGSQGLAGKAAWPEVKRVAGNVKNLAKNVPTYGKRVVGAAAKGAQKAIEAIKASGPVTSALSGQKVTGGLQAAVNWGRTGTIASKVAGTAVKIGGGTVLTGVTTFVTVFQLTTKYVMKKVIPGSVMTSSGWAAVNQIVTEESRDYGKALPTKWKRCTPIIDCPHKKEEKPKPWWRSWIPGWWHFPSWLWWLFRWWIYIVLAIIILLVVVIANIGPTVPSDAPFNTPTPQPVSTPAINTTTPPVPGTPTSTTPAPTTPTQTFTTPAAVPIITQLSFAHVQPGVYSEVYLDIQGAPGQAVTATLTGTAVSSSSTLNGHLDDSGKLRLTWKITSFGTYTAKGTVDQESFTKQVKVQG